MQKDFKDKQYYKFCMYGFFKNLQLFDAFLMLFFIEQGISFLQIGTLYAIREITILILEIPTGVFADIIGRRKTMITSFLGYIVSFIIFFLSTNYFLLIIAMLFFGFGNAMRTGTHKAIIFDYLKIRGWETQKLNYYGRTRSWSQIGSAVSSLIAAAIVISFNSYKWIFIFSTLPYVIDLFLIWSYPKSLDGPIKAYSNDSLNIKFVKHFKDIKTVFKSANLWHTLTNLSFFQGYFKSIKDYLQPLIVVALSGVYFKTIEIPERMHPAFIGLIYFLIFLITSSTSRNVKKLTKHFKSENQTLNTTLFSGLLLGVIIGLLMLTDNNLMTIPIFILIYIVQNIRKPYGAYLIASKVKNETMATSLSIQSQLDAIYAAIFAILLGFLADKYSLSKAILLFGILLMGISLLIEFLALMLKKRNERSN